MTANVRRDVRPPSLEKLANPLVRMILGSPLHRMLDHSVLVLHLTDRKTGRRYHIPVAYVDMDMTGELAIVTADWWL